MRVLARTWQMLLKGIAEVEAAGRPIAAAEMVLVRIAYAADLPTPDEVIRSLGDSRAATARAPATHARRRHRARAPPRREPRSETRSGRRAAASRARRRSRRQLSRNNEPSRRKTAACRCAR